MKLKDAQSLDQQEIKSDQVNEPVSAEISSRMRQDFEDDNQSQQTQDVRQHASTNDELPVTAQQLDSNRMTQPQISRSDSTKSTKKKSCFIRDKRNTIINAVLCLICFLIGFPSLFMIHLPISYCQRKMILYVVILNTLIILGSKLVFGRSMLSPLQLFVN